MERSALSKEQMRVILLVRGNADPDNVKSALHSQMIGGFKMRVYAAEAKEVIHWYEHPEEMSISDHLFETVGMTHMHDVRRTHLILKQEIEMTTARSPEP